MLTGPGISADSGIQDFRVPGGIWERFNPMRYAEYSVFLRRPDYYWNLERNMIPMFANAKPNLNHHALVDLEKKKKIDILITQNFDNLHQIAGNKVPIIELGGNAYRASCMDCGINIKRGYILKRLNAGDNVPHCPICGGRIKTGILLFNEPIPEEIIESAINAAETCDLFVVIGSNLVVYPANNLPIIAKKAGSKVIYFNLDQTMMDKYCTLRFLGDIKTNFPPLVKQI